MYCLAFNLGDLNELFDKDKLVVGDKLLRQRQTFKSSTNFQGIDKLARQRQSCKTKIDLYGQDKPLTERQTSDSKTNLILVEAKLARANLGGIYL